MQFTKPMIDLVYEIRRRVDADMKPGIKLANPDMLHELSDFYPHNRDVVLHALIKELFFLAGGEWLTRAEKQTAQPPKQTMKAYRGQISLEDSSATEINAQTNATESSKPQRIYRGQIVHD
jgi:hypothetical protein